MPSGATSATGLFATESGRVFTYFDSGLHYTDSLDGSWSDSSVTRVTATDELLVFQDDGAGRLLARDKDELFQSHDEGATWSAVALDPLLARPAGALRSAASTPQGIYASGSDVTLLTTDDGQSWTLVSHTTGTDATRQGELFSGGLRYTRSADRWVKLDRSPTLITGGGVLLEHNDQGLSTSADLGETWSSISSVVEGTLATNTLGTVVSMTKFKGLSVYRDGGWAQIGPSVDGSFDATAVLPDGRVVVLWRPPGEDSRIGVTSDAVAATELPAPHDYPSTCSDGTRSAGEEDVDCGGSCLPCHTYRVYPAAPLDIVPFAVTPTGALLAGTKDGKLWRSTDEGRTFAPVAADAPPQALAAARDGAVYYIAEPDCYASTDDGRTFAKVNAAPIPISNARFVVTAAGTLYYEQSGQAARSSDKGVTWTRQDLPDIWGGLVTLDSGALFIRASKLSRSLDDGVTWEPVPLSWDPGGYIRFSDAGHDVLAANSTDALHISADKGASFTPVVPPESISGTSDVYAVTPEHYVYSGKSVFVSEGGVNNWRPARVYGLQSVRKVVLPNGHFVSLDAAHGQVSVSNDPAQW